MAFQDRRLKPLANPFLHFSMPRGTAAKRVHSYAGYVPYDLAELISYSDDPTQHSGQSGSDSEIQGAMQSISTAEAASCRESVDNSDSPIPHLPTLLQARNRSPQTCSQIAAATRAINQHSGEPSVASGTKMATSFSEVSSTNSAEARPRRHRRCHGSATVELRHFDSVGDHSPGCAGVGEKTTTVMMRNLPSTLSLKALMQEINRSGFRGRFDFCYMPCDFSTGRSQGFAFVNFLTAEAAHCFFQEWHGSKRFVQKDCDSPLNVSAAGIQGLEDNLAKWNTSRTRRIKNPQLRPFVAPCKGPADGVLSEKKLSQLSSACDFN
mmetsp:Transcript_18571/g.40588  ORF Transcript_18571/g.40588 Transcript_18571/m.40588 type:complete len:323 (+) Transcript_18571:73-1041(+)